MNSNIGSIGTANAGGFVESDIRTWSDADYRRLLAEFGEIFDVPEESARYPRLLALADLIEAYEKVHHAIERVPTDVVAKYYPSARTRTAA